MVMYLSFFLCKIYMFIRTFWTDNHQNNFGISWKSQFKKLNTFLDIVFEREIRKGIKSVNNENHWKEEKVRLFDWYEKV